MTSPTTDNLVRLQQRLQAEVERIATALNADLVTAFVYDEDNARFRLPVGAGLNDIGTFLDRRMIPRAGRVAGMVAREQRRIVSGRVPGQTPMDGPFARRENVESAAGYPLLTTTGRVVGVLFVSYRTTHEFPPDELEAI